MSNTSMFVPKPSKDEIAEVIKTPAWETSGIVGRLHLNVMAPRGRAFVRFANCDFLVHEYRKWVGFCCVCCCMHHFGIGYALIYHGPRCEGRLATEIKFEEVDGTPFPGPVAEPLLPCASTCTIKTQCLFKEAGRELPLYEED